MRIAPKMPIPTTILSGPVGGRVGSGVGVAVGVAMPPESSIDMVLEQFELSEIAPSLSVNVAVAVNVPLF